MCTSEQVKKDLRDIRYYFYRKKQLEEVAAVVGPAPVKGLVEKYNRAIREAPLRLYDLYACLCVRGLTLDAVAIELCYTPQYIRKLASELHSYLQNKLYQEAKHEAES